MEPSASAIRRFDLLDRPAPEVLEGFMSATVAPVIATAAVDVAVSLAGPEVATPAVVAVPFAWSTPVGETAILARTTAAVVVSLARNPPADVAVSLAGPEVVTATLATTPVVVAASLIVVVTATLAATPAAVAVSLAGRLPVAVTAVLAGTTPMAVTVTGATGSEYFWLVAPTDGLSETILVEAIAEEIVFLGSSPSLFLSFSALGIVTPDISFPLLAAPIDIPLTLLSTGSGWSYVTMPMPSKRATDPDSCADGCCSGCDFNSDKYNVKATGLPRTGNRCIMFSRATMSLLREAIN